MSNVTIGKELLERIFDFAEHAYSYTPNWASEKYSMEAEWARLHERVQAVLAAPSPVADPVTYTVKLQERMAEVTNG